MKSDYISLGITRREALKKISMGAVACTIMNQMDVNAITTETMANTSSDWENPYRDIRGFSYQPSYEATGYSIWHQFRPEKFDIELGLGKKFFPKINAVRYWLSFDAFAVDPLGFSKNFEIALEIAHQYGLRVLPTLFNNWHSVPDFGGIANEMLLYWFENHGKKGMSVNYVFRPFLERIVGDHANDNRILAWDLCNEPHNNGNWHLTSEWLTHTYKLCKELGAVQPVSVSVVNLDQIKDVEVISDLFLIHPYFAEPDRLREVIDFARQKEKGVLATECCWGSLDDAERVKIVISDCRALSQAGIGFMPHALQESYVGDLHRAQFGILSSASSMHFVTMDGSLRPGHEVFNDF